MKNLYFLVLCCLLGFVTGCSDDDTATALLQIDPSTDLVFEAVGGTWCPTGKLYLCKWDTEHTILAVGVAADENPGVLLRQSHTFTKAGAAPVSEFVAPESQGVRTGTMKIAPHVASVRNYK